MSFFSFELDPALAADPVFDLHQRGKMAIAPTVPLSSRDDLSLAYTPGVARVCEAIAEEPDLAADYTWTGNVVAVVSDGSAVLGLGNIGPKAAMPVNSPTIRATPTRSSVIAIIGPIQVQAWAS